jgi:hypothetical protein
MAFLTRQLQTMSDLHVETPISRPLYSFSRLQLTGSDLFLLGDVGLVKAAGLFAFLRHLLKEHRGYPVF